MEDKLIELKDGNYIKDFKHNSVYIQGCETCDYGSKYVDNLEIIMNDDKMIIQTSALCGYEINLGSIIKIFAKTDFSKLAKEDFLHFMTIQINQLCSDNTEIKIYYESMSKEWIIQPSKSIGWCLNLKYDSKDKAISEGIKYSEQKGLSRFKIGRLIPCNIPVLNTNNVVTTVRKEMYSYYKVEEGTKAYLDNISKQQYSELEEKLNEVFYNWNIKHNLQPTCYEIIDNEIVEVNKNKQ